MSNYPTESDLSSATGTDMSKFAKKDYLASLKLDVDKLDIDKLETALVHLSKVSNVVKMMLLILLILVTEYNAKIVEIEKKSWAR